LANKEHSAMDHNTQSINEVEEMPTTGWGYYIQGSDQQLEMEELGSWLSQIIHCPVHYPAWGKPIYECRCGVLFPRWFVTACKPEMVNEILKAHTNGYKLQESWASAGKTSHSVPRYNEKEIVEACGLNYEEGVV